MRGLVEERSLSGPGMFEPGESRRGWGAYKSAMTILVVAVLLLTGFSTWALVGDPDEVTARASLDPAGSVKSKTVLVGEPVGFYGSSSTGSTPLNYSWSLRDGETSNQADVTHTYTEPGSYEIALVVQDASGRMDLDRVTVNVRQPLPGVDFRGADAGPDATAVEDEVVIFDGSHSLDAWPSSTDPATLEFSWDFGDGSVAAGDTIATHAYGNAGTYTVRLTVTDFATGAFGVDTATVTVTNVPPTANAGPASLIVWEDDVVTFDGGGSAETTSDLVDLAYAWDFGDGSRGAGPVVTHAYTSAGTYATQLTITDDNAASSTATVAVTIMNRPPIADAGTDLTVVEGDPAFFDGRSSTDTYSDSTTLVYAWTPESGAPTLSGWGPTYTWFDDQGSAQHPFTLQVTDDDDASSAATTNVTVLNVPPRVGITGVWWFSNEILFEGKAFDPGADDLTFVWRVGGASGPEWDRSTSFANGRHPREVVSYAAYLFPSSVSAVLPKTFTLVVYDDDGAGGFDSVTFVLAKSAAPPAPSCVVPPDILPGCALPPRDARLVDGLAPRFDAGPDVQLVEDLVAPIFVPSSFDDPSSTSWTLLWEWGDGTTTQMDGVTDPLRAPAAHDFTKAGTYTVTLTIIGTGGLTVDGFIAIVRNVAPVAEFSAPASVQEDQTFTLSGASSTDTPADRTTLRYLWSFSDGGTLTAAAGSHAFTQVGVASIRLTVIDDNGASSQKLATFGVANVPPVAAAQAASVTQGAALVLDGSSSSDTPSDHPLLAFTWAQGGATVATGWNPVLPTPDEGIVGYVLEIRDDNGAASSVGFSVTIEPREPLVYAGPDLHVYGAVRAITLEGYAVDASPAHVLQPVWTFGDGGSAIGFAVSHGYAATGTYTACLTVFDGASATQDCATVRVDVDTDGDDLLDEAERIIGTDPTLFDTDSDGLTDFYEYMRSHTDPTSSDTDNDGLNDWEELFPGNDGYITNPTNPDTDDDGIRDGEEVHRGVDTFLTNPLDTDTDDDRIQDGVETGVPGRDAPNSGTTDPTRIDTDGDGLPDGWVDCGSGPSGCVFSDHEIGYDPITNPDPDGDDGTTERNGQVDRFESEDASFNGQVDAGETDAALADTDGDGLPDGLEQGYTDALSPQDLYLFGLARRDSEPSTTTDPLDRDSDDDGLFDGTEDTNRDGRLDPTETDPLIRDTDGDSLTDGQEVGLGWPAGYSSLPEWQLDPSSHTADGPAGFAPDTHPVTRTSPLVGDTDGDGLPDGWIDLDQDTQRDLGEFEDRDLDGLVDGGLFTGQAGTAETDPNMPDTDTDGLLDRVEELVHGTNPIRWDTDGDGMPDGWELRYPQVLNPFVDDAGKDPDTDGLANLREYQLDTDPSMADTDLDFIIDGADAAPTTYDVDPDVLADDDIVVPSSSEFLPEVIVINEGLGVEVAVDYAHGAPDATITISPGADTFGTALVGGVIHIAIVPQGGAILPSYRAVVKVKFGQNPVDRGGNPVDPRYLLMYGWIGDTLGEWVLMKHATVGEETWRNVPNRFVWGVTTLLGDVAIADTTQRDFDRDGWSDGAEFDVADTETRITALCDTDNPTTCQDPNHERGSWVTFETAGDVTYYLRVPMAKGSRETVSPEGGISPLLSLTTLDTWMWPFSADELPGTGDAIVVYRLDYQAIPFVLDRSEVLRALEIRVNIVVDNWPWYMEVREALPPTSPDASCADGGPLTFPSDTFIAGSTAITGGPLGERWIRFTLSGPLMLPPGCYYLVVYHGNHNQVDRDWWLTSSESSPWGKWAFSAWGPNFGGPDPDHEPWVWWDGVVPAYRLIVGQLPRDVFINVRTSPSDGSPEWTQPGYVHPSAGIPMNADNGLTVDFSDSLPVFQQILEDCNGGTCTDEDGYLFIPLLFHSSEAGRTRVDGINVFIRGATGADALSDSDQDGLSDSFETTWSSSRPSASCLRANNPDSDGDGLLDGADPLWWRDTDGDGRANVCDHDSDGDGLWDGWHDDGDQAWEDGELLGEWNLGSDALLADSDGDGLWDGWVDAFPFESCDGETKGEAGTGITGSPSPCGFGTDPLYEDTDGDGLSDIEETVLGVDVYLTDPLDADMDDDFLLDSFETLGWQTEMLTSIEAVCNVIVVLYGVENCGDVNPDSEPVDANDGRAAEAIAPYYTRYHVTSDPADMDRDTDDDGLSDFDEFLQRTDPRNSDSDGDRLRDGDKDGTDFEEEPGIVELVKPFIGLTWTEHVFSGDCGIAIKCVIVDVHVRDNAALSKLVIVLDGKVDREVNLTGWIDTTLRYEFGIGLLDAFTGKTVNFIIVDVNGNPDEAWLSQGTVGDFVMDKIKEATVSFLGPEVGGLIAGLWDFFWGMFAGPAALIKNAGTIYDQATKFAQEILNSTDLEGRVRGLFQSFWDAMVAQADAAVPDAYKNDPTCGSNPWDLNCNYEKFSYWYWVGNAIGMILTIMTGASVTHALKDANIGAKIATVLSKFPTLERAVLFASNVYKFMGRFAVRAALAAAAFALSYELAELFGGFFDTLFVTGFGAAAVLMMARMNMDFFGFNPADLFDSSAQSAFRGAMRARGFLSLDEVSRLGAYSDAVQKAALRGIDEGVLDFHFPTRDLGIRPGLLDRWAKYLDNFHKGGGNLDQLLSDINLYKTKVGAVGAFRDLQNQLASSAPRALENVGFTISEWRAVVRGSGHSFGDVTHVSQKFDINGNPVERGNYLAALDAKVVSPDSIDILEVKSTKNWPGRGGLNEYLDGSGQITRQRQLLQIWGGDSILLYIDGSLMERAKAFLAAEGITDVRLFAIPGT